MVSHPKPAKWASLARPGDQISTPGWFKRIFSAGKRWRMDTWRKNYPIRRFLLGKDRQMCLDGSEMSRVSVRVTRRQRRGGGRQHYHHHHHHHYLNGVLPTLSTHCSFWEISRNTIMVFIIWKHSFILMCESPGNTSGSYFTTKSSEFRTLS